MSHSTLRLGRVWIMKGMKQSVKKTREKKTDNEQKKGKGRGRKHTGLWIFLLIFAFIGVTGGVLIKLGFFGEMSDYFMPTTEANRLISYLGLNDFNYADRWGSSFTVKDVKDLLQASGVPEEQAGMPLSHKPGFLPVTRRQFEALFEVLIRKLELDRLALKSLYIYDVDRTGGLEMDGIVYERILTSDGDYYMEKEYAFPGEYIGSVVRVYVSNNEIVLCMGESSETVVLKNAYFRTVVEEDGKSYVLAYVNGRQQKLPASKSILDAGVLTEDKWGLAASGRDILHTDAAEGSEAPGDGNAVKLASGCLCDITIGNDGVMEINDHTAELVEARVSAYSDGLITVEGYEDTLFLSEFFNVYKVKGAFKAMQSAGLLIGYDRVLLYIRDNMLEGALLIEDIYAKNIRVLISNSDYTNYYHSELTITSDTDYTITYGEVIEEHSAGERIIFSNGSEQLKNGPARITSKEEDGRITINSLERQSGKPSYRGTLELSRDDRGVLVINELPVEEYLYGVVPSEMPVTYEMEALKAQAICARAYAFAQMESDNYSQYGAHLDDSIYSQVYNNVAEDERAIRAVDDTYGVVPCYGDEVVEAFFFSTSCGTTSSNSAVWGGNQEPYLLDTMETELNDLADLSDENRFKEFIDGNPGDDFIERDEPFFRWSVGYTTETLTNTINRHLYERIQAMPEYILAKNAAGSYEKKSINTIGDLVSVEVTKRGNSGIIEEMEIVGTAETILVKGQTNARALLSPEDVTIRKQDGSTLNGWSTLPSAYYYVENGNGFLIHGGGFGHGVGLSQNGANDMARLGYLSTDIISHYFTGVELKDMYQLAGE